MSKFTPTTKPTYEIRMLIDPDPFSKCYVNLVSDPIDTHAIYNVDKDKVDDFKERIKKIGGKYIHVVSSAMQNRKVIYFALEITPEEETKMKMEELKKARFQAAFDSKLAEVKDNILLREAGATNEIALKKFARYLLDGTLDSIVPLESYVFIDDPTDKDEQRIYDIIRKANDGCAGCVGMVTNSIIKMVSLAEDMNKKITKEDKRLRRRAVCMKYGLNFLAKCFESSAA